MYIIQAMERGELKAIYVDEIAVMKLRDRKVLDHDNLRPPVLHPKKINVITGCNGSFKTTFLEALTVGLYMSSLNTLNSRLIMNLSSTLRMDNLWFYFLAKDGFELTINGYKVSNASDEELLKVVVPPFNPLIKPVGFKLVKGDKVVRILRIDLQPLPSGINTSIIDSVIDQSIPLSNYSFISFSVPNPLSHDFVTSFMPLVNFSKIKDTLKKVLDYELIGSKFDEFGRPTIIISEGDKDVEIQFLGSGIASLILLTMASSNDIIVFDNIENHLHPQLMLKVIDLMRESKSQWFVSTQSAEFLNYLLNENPEEVMVYEFLKRDEIHIRQIDGEKAKELISELYEDLRGNC